MRYPKNTVTIKSGETIAYIQGGSGDKTLLAIHGNMASSVFMSGFIDNAPAGYRVFAPDLCGFGDSSYNTPTQTLEQMACQMYEFCEAVGITSAAVVGWSLGGGVAMEMAALYPELVTHLVLISAAPCTGFPLFYKNEDGSFAPYLSIEAMSADPLVLFNQQALAAKNIAYCKAAYDAVTYNVNKPSEEEYDYQMSETVKQVNLLDADWALAVFNMTDAPNLYGQGSGRLKNIVCPVLLTSGELDMVVPAALMQQNITAFGERAKHIQYEKAGHAQFIDCPERFFADMYEFLGE